MTESYTLNIFDNYGSVSSNLDEAQIAKCSPQQQAVLFPLLAAWADAQAEDAACEEVERAKRKAQTAYDRATAVLEAATPVRSFHDEWLRTVAKQPEPDPDPVLVKKIKAATKVVEAAEAYLGECVVAVLPAQARRDQRRREFGEYLKAWVALDTAPKNVGDLVRARVATETRQKLQNLKDGMPVDYVEHAASTVGNSHLDRFKAGQGRGGSANYGYNRNAMRGAQLKVPSER